MTRTRNPWLALLALLTLTATLLSLPASPVEAADAKDVALFSWHNSVASPDEDAAPFAGISSADDGACTDVLQEDQTIRRAILDQGSTVTILGVDPQDAANADDWSAALSTVDSLVVPELNGGCTFAPEIIAVVKTFVEAGGTLVVAATGDDGARAIANGVLGSSIVRPSSNINSVATYARQAPLQSDPSAPATLARLSRTVPVALSSLPTGAEAWYMDGAYDHVAVWRGGTGNGNVYGFGWDWYPQVDGTADWNTVLSLVAAGTIVSTPSIAYAPSTIDAEAGTAISPRSPTNSGGATDGWSVAPALPSGLTINVGNGVISGTPTVAAPSADYTVTATNAAGSGTAVLTITVAAAPKVATTVELTASATTVLAGGPLELTATVVGNDPTGTVEFFDGASSLGTAPLTSPAVLTISSLAIGPHSITAGYTGDDGNESSSTTAPLELAVVPVPSAQFDTTTPTAGDTLPVTGEGFQPGSEVTITLGDDSTVLGSATVADDGTFSIDVVLPDDVDGDQQLTIAGTDQTGGSTSIVIDLTGVTETSDVVEPTVPSDVEVTVATSVPVLDCVPRSLQVGSVVTCTVTGGGPGIEILWRAAYNPVIAEAGVTLDANGSGTFSFVVPAAALGQELTVELAEWTQPMTLGVVGGPVPASVPAGEGSVPFGAVLLALFAAAGAVVAGRRLVTAG